MLNFTDKLKKFQLTEYFIKCLSSEYIRQGQIFKIYRTDGLYSFPDENQFGIVIVLLFELQ